MVATILGDIHGSIAFENSGFITQNGLITGFTVGLFLGANALYLCTLENVFFILGNGKNKFVQACEYIIEGLAWLAIFAISYFSYALTYTLHDPSTE
jgi:hypothetical protein